MKPNTETIHITYKFLNGNNDGSILSNKEFHVCYCIIDTDIITKKMKKIIGCFINPNDIILENDNKDIEKNIYYFQRYLKLNEMFTISDLLDNTINSKNYNNYLMKKVLYNKENKIISKCVNTLKEKLLIQ